MRQSIARSRNFRVFCSGLVIFWTALIDTAELEPRLFEIPRKSKRCFLSSVFNMCSTFIMFLRPVYILLHTVNHYDPADLYLRMPNLNNAQHGTIKISDRHGRNI